MQKCATASPCYIAAGVRSDFQRFDVARFGGVAFNVARIMMAVARKHQTEIVALGAGWPGCPGNDAFEKRMIAKHLFGAAVQTDVAPARHGCAQDDVRTGLHDRLRHVVEECDLAAIDVARQLRVDAEQPPIAGQLEGKVAARLLGPAAANSAPSTKFMRWHAWAPRTEQSQEGAQSIVPIVIARYGVDVGGLQRFFGAFRLGS